MSVEHGHGGATQSAAKEQAIKGAEAVTDTTANVLFLFMLGFLFFFGINATVQPESHGHGGH